MTTFGVLGAKGGCGTSLVASNLCVALSWERVCLLVDLNAVRGCDDLLLDLEPQRTWADLLPVAGELTRAHLGKVLSPYRSRAGLLAAPPSPVEVESYSRIGELIGSLGRFSPWVILDLPSGDPAMCHAVITHCDRLLLVSTADVPALRACRRLLVALPTERPSETALVLNQIGAGHPIQPKALASSLGLPIVGALPRDMRGVGNQVAFGHPAVLDRQSPFGWEARALAERLVRSSREGARGRAGTRLVQPGGGQGEHREEVG
jgi:Flp pilus assembly CpaE family ATPase